MATIKIIDDDVEVADLLAAALGYKGHKATAAYSTDGAVELLASEKPDVLVLDMMFPEDPAGGLKLAISLSRDVRTSSLPIILLTNVNQEFPISLSGKDIDPEWMPVREFLEKPVDLAKLEEIIKRLVSS